MPPTAEDRLLDILEAIAGIDEILAGCRFEQFTTDKTRRMATERYLEIICEAARKLPDDIKQEERDIDWRKMNDFGNRLRLLITRPMLSSSGTSSKITYRT